ncbi:hypothetical protein [Fibrivirga algicola]|uniref:DUF3106 domain-containing protein n=1 Tax=Fibrivirga algicola TaxID=2950420 RepID=A0ABX0QFK1_9BACT|nr:hypothetical protein [Fibrivirga algicola]ARK10983.1 hypothetical protein A6C57_11950 [Fibrella sp. ES10-3-2-2]NID09767.1 hypothetical protein [Fibrivirga algicola]
MKSPLLFAALLLAVTGSATFAQSPNGRYDRNPYNTPAPRGNGPAYGQGYGNQGNGRFDYDRRQDLFQVRQLDQIVNLTNRQKRDVLKIENYYDREMSQAPRTASIQQRLLWQKNQDVISILSPAQRDRLFAFEQYRSYNQGSYASGRGNLNVDRDWTPPTGRRW